MQNTNIKVYMSVGESEIERPYGSPCLVCRDYFSIGDKYYLVSTTQSVRGVELESFTRAHSNCALGERKNKSTNVKIKGLR